MRFPRFFIVLSIISFGLPACSTANRFLKVGPARLTPFFEQPNLAKDGSRQFGFQKVWTTPDRAVLNEGLTKKKLHIAPVTVDYLRSARKAQAGRQVAAGGVKRSEREVATRLRQEFSNAFQHSPAPFYQLTDRPGPDTVVLQLALTELKATSAQGNAITTVLKLLVTPFAAVGGFFTKGNIAIEGKMLVTMPGKDKSQRPFFQFADKERDKLTLFSLRDYRSYGHANQTMREWAIHFEQLTRATKGGKVKDSSAVTLRMY